MAGTEAHCGYVKPNTTPLTGDDGYKSGPTCTNH
jgi:hypothetical protein